MQAKLPDVNAAIVRHRSLAEEGFKNGDFDLALVSLECINALLPILPEEIDPSTGKAKSYKVEVNTEEYEKLTKETKEIFCKKCEEKSFLELVDQFEVELDWLEQILSRKKTDHFWLCPKCNKSNVFDNDDIEVTKNGEPYYYKVIPSPPPKEYGIKSSKDYIQKFKKWYSIAMPEIESQIGIYRTEYAAQESKSENLPELPQGA